MGIEPMSQAWEARILPLNYARVAVLMLENRNHPSEATKKLEFRARWRAGSFEKPTNIRLPVLHI